MLSIVIFHVVVPLASASDFAAEAPSILPLEFVNVHLSTSPPKTKIDSDAIDEVISDLPELKVASTTVKNLPLKLPAIAPLLFEAITISSPADNSLASVTNFHFVVFVPESTLNLAYRVISVV
mgnify:CR=1 FL=1